MVRRSLWILLSILAVVSRGSAQTPPLKPAPEAGFESLSLLEILLHSRGPRDDRPAGPDGISWWLARQPPVALPPDVPDDVRPFRLDWTFPAADPGFGGILRAPGSAADDPWKLAAHLPTPAGQETDPGRTNLEQLFPNLFHGPRHADGTGWDSPLLRPTEGVGSAGPDRDAFSTADAVPVLDPATNLWGRGVRGLLSLARRHEYVVLTTSQKLPYLNPDDGAIDRATLATAALNLSLFLQDHSDADNQLLSGLLGLKSAYRWSQLSLDLQPRLAVSSIRQTVSPVGSFLPDAGLALGDYAPWNDPGAPPSQSAYLGVRSQNRLSVVPEMQIEISYYLSHSLRTFVGYDFLFWSDGVRPGDPLDRAGSALQPGSQAGPTLTAPLFNDRGFWAQGLTFGLEVRY